MSEAIRARIGAELERTRGRTTVLTDAVDADDLVKQHSPLMSPLVWDLAHVGNQEELWLVRDVGGLEPVRCDIDNLYDAFKNPRKDRPSLPLLSPAEARAYNRTVRDKVLDILDRTSLAGRRLVADGFAFGMIVQHEQQHDETMLVTHQLRAGPVALSAPPPPPARVTVTGEVPVPAGRFSMGTSVEPWALDNERPAPRHANLGQRHLSPAPVGAYPDGASPLGVHQLIGDVWEWVDTDFHGYPGFAAFPYREYSEVFFGPRYKVLRGGSFGTDAAACRGTFRNWDHPVRRQIFSGFRCARDAGPGELG